MASWSVLRADWALLRFPVISGVLSAILGALVVVVLWATGIFDAAADTGTEELPVGSLIGMFLLYLVTSFVVVFCNTTLASLVLARFNGEPVNPDTGWAAARARWPQILGWSAISATIGVLLNVVSGRGGRLGEIVAMIGAAAWALATFLVIPILVAESVGPVTATKRSATLLKRTWGEQIVGNAGIGLVTALIMVAVVAAGAGLIALAAMTGQAAVVVVAVIPVVIAVALVIAVSSALGTIYRSAVYQYATGQQLAGFGDPDLLANAFTRQAGVTQTGL